MVDVKSRWLFWYAPGRRPAPNTFERGLSLAGAVSAGAYTAGVLDFLFEALDTWEAAKLAAGVVVFAGDGPVDPKIRAWACGHVDNARALPACPQAPQQQQRAA